MVAEMWATHFASSLQLHNESTVGCCAYRVLLMECMHIENIKMTAALRFDKAVLGVRSAG